MFGEKPEAPPLQFGSYTFKSIHANVTILPGTDRSPEDGYHLIRNSSVTEGVPTLYLGEFNARAHVALGQEIVYNDAFKIKNLEACDIHLVGFNFSQLIGTEYLAFYIKNDTNADGVPDGDWIAIWLGNQTLSPANGNQLNSTHSIFLKTGGELPVKIVIMIPEKTLEDDEQVTLFVGSGTIYIWFSQKASFT